MKEKSVRFVRSIAKIALLLCGIFLVLLGVYYTYRSIRFRPYKVRVSNVTDSAFTVSWVTDEPMVGVVYYGEKDSFLPGPLSWLGKKKAVDDRDVSEAQTECVSKFNKKVSKTRDENFTVDASGFDCHNVKVFKKGHYYTHHVTVGNLDADKEYFFRVGNGYISYKTNNGIYAEGEPLGEDEFSVHTKKTFENISTPNPAYGIIEEVYQTADGVFALNKNFDSMLFLSVYSKNGTVHPGLFSSVANKDGGWSIDLSNVRDEEGDIVVGEDTILVFMPQAENHELFIPKTHEYNTIVFPLRLVSNTEDSVKKEGAQKNLLEGIMKGVEAWTPLPDQGCTRYGTVGRTQFCGGICVRECFWVVRGEEQLKGWVSSDLCVCPQYCKDNHKYQGCDGPKEAVPTPPPAVTAGESINPESEIVLFEYDFCPLGKRCRCELEIDGKDASFEIVPEQTIRRCSLGNIPRDESSPTPEVRVIVEGDPCPNREECTCQLTLGNSTVSYTINSNDPTRSCSQSNMPKGENSTSQLNPTTEQCYYYDPGLLGLGETCYPVNAPATGCSGENYYLGDPGCGDNLGCYTFNHLSPGGSCHRASCLAAPYRSYSNCESIREATISDYGKITAFMINAEVFFEGAFKTVDSFDYKSEAYVCCKFSREDDRKVVENASLASAADCGRMAAEFPGTKPLDGAYHFSFDNCPDFGEFKENEEGINRRYMFKSLAQGESAGDKFLFFPERGVYSVISTLSQSKIFFLGGDGKKYVFYQNRDGKEGYQSPLNPLEPRDDEDLLIPASELVLSVSKETTVQELHLSQGINIVSFDLIPSLGELKQLDSSDFLNIVNRSDHVISRISPFNSGQWGSGMSYDFEVKENKGIPFPLSQGRGYLVMAEKDATIFVPGYKTETPIPIAFSSGWNLIGVHGHNTAYTAKSLINSVNSIEGLQANNVTYWPTSKGMYQGFQLSEGQEYGQDFPISKDLGYFVRINDFKALKEGCKSINWNPGGPKNGECN